MGGSGTVERGAAGPKRNRKAEVARKEERVRLGLPPRVNLGKALARAGGAKGSDVEMDELEEEADELEEAEVVEQLVLKKRKKRRVELLGTFFPTKALRDSALASLGVSRGSRRSSRVEYAFGQPTPSVRCPPPCPALPTPC